jgi:hypothetical protein
MLLIHAFGTTQVEIGWITDTPQISDCNIQSSSSNPWVFRFWITGSLYHCSYYNSPRPTPNTFYQYRIVRDGTNDDQFHTWFDGSEIGSIIDMSAGSMSLVD